MPRRDEDETDKIIAIVRDIKDKTLYVGFKSVIYVEKDSKDEDLEYFYDAADNKQYVRDYRHFIQKGEIEILT